MYIRYEYSLNNPTYMLFILMLNGAKINCDFCLSLSSSSIHLIVASQHAPSFVFQSLSLSFFIFILSFKLINPFFSNFFFTRLSYFLICHSILIVLLSPFLPHYIFWLTFLSYFLLNMNLQHEWFWYKKHPLGLHINPATSR